MGSVRSVAALPMSICPQAMSYGRPSREVERVSPVRPCLAAVYGAESGRGAVADIEPLLMILPPQGDWLFILRNAACVQRNAPVKVVSSTADHCSYSRSSRGTAGAPRPALLNRGSMRP